MSLNVRLGLGCARRIAIAASEAPPSLALKNLIWLALGLASVIVQATIEPLRGANDSLVCLPTLSWKPVVRLTARHGLPGQLGTVGGVVAPITPSSASVAGATAGSTRASTRLTSSTGTARLIMAVATRALGGCSDWTISLAALQFLRGLGDRLRVARARGPG